MNRNEEIRSAFPHLAARDARQLSPLTLAYIGDTVYDLIVRTVLIHEQERTPHALHKLATKQVCAAGQAAAYVRIAPLLTEEEAATFRRGRNAHSGTQPKNASSADYHTATGLEALVGYLYLKGEDARLLELMRRALESDEAEQ